MSTTKTPGQTARQAYFHTDTMSHWENLPATHKGDWERVAQVVLSAHAPKITAEELQKAHDELNIKATTVGTIGDQIVLGPVSAARLADAINSILQSRQPATQEQEYDYLDAGVIIQKGDEFRSPDGDWIKSTGFSSDGCTLTMGNYRRPRQPQRAGKERPEWMPSTPRDWTEDYPHENGNYECHCVKCGKKFYGHKRRVICKPCAAASGDISARNPAADPTLIGGWPIKQWEFIKEFLISYSMYSEAAMIRWVIREGQKSPKGGEGGMLTEQIAVGGIQAAIDFRAELRTARAELAALHEENCILKSQVENADVNLAQVRAAVVQRYDAELAKVKGELEAMTKERDEWDKVGEAAERIGWNGIENSKLLEQFILDAGEELTQLRQTQGGRLTELKWRPLDDGQAAACGRIIVNDPEGDPDACYFGGQGSARTHYIPFSDVASLLPPLPPLPTAAPELDAFEKWAVEDHWLNVLQLEKGSDGKYTDPEAEGIHAFLAGQAQGGKAK